MPVISRFFGIIIYIYWKDHSPPHFHARYCDQEIAVDIRTGEIKGTMSKRAVQMINEWRNQHIKALLENWTKAENKEKLNPIDPLE